MSQSGEQEELLDPDFIRKLDQLDIVSRKVFAGKMRGERRSKRRGQSVEFADYRNYVVGDDLRHIDWNIYGRLERLFLKLFLEEEDLRVYLVLDGSASMAAGDPPKLLLAKRIAAALAYVALANHDRVVLEAFAGRGGADLGGVRGRRNMFKVIDYLHGLQPADAGSLQQACRSFALRHRAPGVAVVVSDFLDKHGYAQALRYLLGRRMEVYVIHVLAVEEVEPDLAGDLRLLDVEDGETVELTISAPLLARYRQTVAAFREEIRRFCAGRGITYLFADNRTDFASLILQYLRRRGLLR
jgi:uncharacterized protein (DUF58 family)